MICKGWQRMPNVRSCLVWWWWYHREDLFWLKMSKWNKFIYSCFVTVATFRWNLSEKNLSVHCMDLFYYFENHLCRLYTVLGLLFHPCILHVNSYILQSMWSLKELLTFNIKEPAIISLMSSSATFSLLFIIFTKRFSVIRPLLVGSNDLRGNKSWQVCPGNCRHTLRITKKIK